MSTAASMSTISITGVHRSFGGLHAVRGLSLQIDQDHITGLIGPNGAGKTTVFNLITGILRPDSGSVTLDGQELSRLSPSAIVRLGVARSFQEVRTFLRMTALENVMVAQPWQGGYLRQLMVPSRASGVDVEAARVLLGRVRLDKVENRIAGSLSYAQQKVLAVARLLATGARFLLLDEPASGLDEASVRQMVELLKELSADGVGICVVEHSMDVIRSLCDRVAFMADGQCVAVGPLDEIMGRADLAELFFGSPQ